DRLVPAAEQLEEPLLTPLGRVALSFGDARGRVPVDAAAGHAPLAEPPAPAPGLAGSQPGVVESGYGAPSGINAVTGRPRAEQVRADDGVEAIGPDQRVAPRLAPVLEPRGDRRGILVQPDALGA